MDDTKIIELFWSRDEKAIEATANKYGRKLHLLANSRLLRKKQSNEKENSSNIFAASISYDLAHWL